MGVVEAGAEGLIISEKRALLDGVKETVMIEEPEERGLPAVIEEMAMAEELEERALPGVVAEPATVEKPYEQTALLSTSKF